MQKRVFSQKRSYLDLLKVSTLGLIVMSEKEK